MRFLLVTGVILIATPVLAAVPTTQEIRALPGQTQVAARIGQFNALYCQLPGAVSVMKRTSS
jgi:hypothetical protein